MNTEKIIKEAVEKKFKIPSHLVTSKYVILGGSLPSEYQSKLARVISVRIKDDVIERLKSGDMEEKYLDYRDLITKVKTEDGHEMEVADNEIDHSIERLP